MNEEKANKILKPIYERLEKEFKETQIPLEYILMFFCGCVEKTITQCIIAPKIVASNDLLIILHNNISFSEAARTMMKLALQREDSDKKRKKQQEKSKLID